MWTWHNAAAVPLNVRFCYREGISEQHPGTALAFSSVGHRASSFASNNGLPYYLHLYRGPTRGPPTSAPPPASAPQHYNQYTHSQGDVQNGPPPMTQAPLRPAAAQPYNQGHMNMTGPLASYPQHYGPPPLMQQVTNQMTGMQITSGPPTAAGPGYGTFEWHLASKPQQFPNPSRPSLLLNRLSHQQHSLLASLAFLVAQLHRLKAPFHLNRHHLPLSQGLFLPLVLLPPQLPWVSSSTQWLSNSTPLQPSHHPTTQDPRLPELKCLQPQWDRATTSLLDHRVLRALQDTCRSLPLSLACRQDTLLNKMVETQ
ncbi:hypothetical protein GOODEAATRI_001392 [Goodea atripinnis]|uniref:Uncharacterized protein n=1 Tax=Goodea atripinnis TaxID=208336 RepID=A0ABV0PK34_9TELE